MPGILIEYLANLYDAVLGTVFITLFCNQKLRRNIALYVIIVTNFLFLSVLSYIASDNLIISVGIPWITWFVYTLTFRDTKIIKRLFSTTLFIIIPVISSTLIIFILSNLMNVGLDELWTSLSINRFLFILLSEIIQTIIAIVILKFVKVDGSFTLWDFLLYFISPMVTAVVLAFFLKMSVTYDMTPYSVLVITVIIMLLVINISAAVLFRRAVQNTSAKHELELLNSRSELEEKRYGEIGNMYRQLQITRHDLKDHLVYIDNLIAEKRYDEVEQYISDRRQELDSTRRVQHTGNRVLDYIINSKLENAKDISFIITGELKELKGVDDLDIASLFGNILDNAIEGTKGSSAPSITLEFSVTGNYQNILCKNSIAASVLKDNPKLHTTKREYRNRHGYGVQSIRRIVEKHNGLIEFYEDEGFFCVHIALNC
ncbi:MAG: GHKL domain-containing protein [Clostridia bacterium]|nr:GHKL domain-containing protein [Clostridia bacterium]